MLILPRPVLLLVLPLACLLAGGKIAVAISFIIGSLIFDDIPEWYIMVSIPFAAIGMYAGFSVVTSIMDSYFFNKHIFTDDIVPKDGDNLDFYEDYR